MNNLQKQIELLEANIQYNKKILHQNKELFEREMQSSKMLAVTMLGAFAIGLIIGRKVDNKDMKDVVHKIPSVLNKVYDGIKILLPLI